LVNSVARTTAISILLLLVMTVGSAGVAEASGTLISTSRFDIGPQRLAAALLRYSEQSGIQVTSPAELLAGRRSPGVKGSLSAQQALQQLLVGTGLKFDVVDDTTVVIRGASATATATASERDGPAPQRVADLRLAQAAEQDSPAQNLSQTVRTAPGNHCDRPEKGGEHPECSDQHHGGERGRAR
jgi:hypothetical protein